MTYEVVVLIATILSGVMVWTTTVIGVVLWLSGRFRRLEILIYSEKNKLMVELDRLETRTQRLELKTFGFTHTGNFPVENT